jgi:plasmid stability protein
MPALLIRNLDDSVREGLRSLAQRHGRSVEAEARAILTREAKAGLRIDWTAIATVDSGQSVPVTRDLVNSTYDDLGT